MRLEPRLVGDARHRGGEVEAVLGRPLAHAVLGALGLDRTAVAEADRHVRLTGRQSTRRLAGEVEQQRALGPQGLLDRDVVVHPLELHVLVLRRALQLHTRLAGAPLGERGAVEGLRVGGGRRPRCAVHVAIADLVLRRGQEDRELVLGWSIAPRRTGGGRSGRLRRHLGGGGLLGGGSLLGSSGLLGGCLLRDGGSCLRGALQGPRRGGGLVERSATRAQRISAGAHFQTVGDAVDVGVGHRRVGAERRLGRIRQTVGVGVRLARIGAHHLLGVVGQTVGIGVLGPAANVLGEQALPHDVSSPGHLAGVAALSDLGGVGDRVVVGVGQQRIGVGHHRLVCVGQTVGIAVDLAQVRARQPLELVGQPVVVGVTLRRYGGWRGRCAGRRGRGCRGCSGRIADGGIVDRGVGGAGQRSAGVDLVVLALTERRQHLRPVTSHPTRVAGDPDLLLHLAQVGPIVRTGVLVAIMGRRPRTHVPPLQADGVRRPRVALRTAEIAPLGRPGRVGADVDLPQADGVLTLVVQGPGPAAGLGHRDRGPGHRLVRSEPGRARSIVDLADRQGRCHGQSPRAAGTTYATASLMVRQERRPEAGDS